MRVPVPDEADEDARWCVRDDPRGHLNAVIRNSSSSLHQLLTETAPTSDALLMMLETLLLSLSWTPLIWGIAS